VYALTDRPQGPRHPADAEDLTDDGTGRLTFEQQGAARVGVWRGSSDRRGGGRGLRR
jgi:hypothetical protein